MVLIGLACLVTWRIGRLTVGEPAARIGAALMWVWPPFLVFWSTKARPAYGDRPPVSPQSCSGWRSRLRERDEPARRSGPRLRARLRRLGDAAVPADARCRPSRGWSGGGPVSCGSRTTRSQACVVGGVAVDRLEPDARAEGRPAGDVGRGRRSRRTSRASATSSRSSCPSGSACGSRTRRTGSSGRRSASRSPRRPSRSSLVALVRRPRGAEPLLVIAAVYPFLYAATSFTFFTDEPRYLTFIAPVPALLLATLLRRPRVAVGALAVAVAWTAFYLVRLEDQGRFRYLGQPANMRPLITLLERRRAGPASSPTTGSRIGSTSRAASGSSRPRPGSSGTRSTTSS